MRNSKGEKLISNFGSIIDIFCLQGVNGKANSKVECRKDDDPKRNLFKIC